MSAVAGIPVGVRTQLHPDLQWSTWTRQLSRTDTQWARKATVERNGVGDYDIWLPGIASETGIAHVTMSADAAASCSVTESRPDGIDQKIRIHCHDRSGLPKDVEPVYVFFAEPAAGPTPMVAIRHAEHPLVFNSTGGALDVQRLGTGDYVAIAAGDAFTGNGYAQITPVGTAPVTCQNAASTVVDGKLRINIRCYLIGADAQPADTEWQLSYVEGTGLHHDPTAPATYATVDGTTAVPVIDTRRSFASNGEVPTIAREGTGRYTLHYNSIGLYPGANAQVIALGAVPRQCTAGMNAHSFAPQLLLYVRCYDMLGKPADSAFGVTFQRAP